MTDHDDSEEYGLGGLPSPLDILDFDTPLDTATPLPARFLLTGIPTAYNQRNTPRCGGYSGAGLKAVQEKRDGHGMLAFDGDWLYQRAQQYDGIPGFHVGTTARGVCKALQKEGARVRGKPGSESKYRIASYSSLPFTYDTIKRTIFTYRSPVLIGADWYAEWMPGRGTKKGVLPKPVHREGGHLFWSWAWDDNVGDRGSLLCQNSWGQYAGSVNGRFYGPVEYLIPNIHDAWKTIDA